MSPRVLLFYFNMQPPFVFDLLSVAYIYMTIRANSVPFTQNIILKYKHAFSTAYQ